MTLCLRCISQAPDHQDPTNANNPLLLVKNLLDSHMSPTIESEGIVITHATIAGDGYRQSLIKPEK